MPFQGGRQVEEEELWEGQVSLRKVAGPPRGPIFAPWDCHKKPYCRHLLHHWILFCRPALPASSWELHLLKLRNKEKTIDDQTELTLRMNRYGRPRWVVRYAQLTKVTHSLTSLGIYNWGCPTLTATLDHAQLKRHLMQRLLTNKRHRWSSPCHCTAKNDATTSLSLDILTIT